MIHHVIEEFIKNFESMEETGLITKRYGLVRPGRIRIENGRDFVVPMLFDKPDIECETLTGGLLIDDRERAVLFVEGDTARRIPNRGASMQYSLSMRIVLWYNESGYETTGESTIGDLLAANLHRLSQTKRNPTGRGFSAISFEPSEIVEGWQVFNKYTFREETGFLFPPYKAFGIQGVLTFNLYEKQNCVGSVWPVALPVGC